MNLLPLPPRRLPLSVRGIMCVELVKYIVPSNLDWPFTSNGYSGLFVPIPTFPPLGLIERDWLFVVCIFAVDESRTILPDSVATCVPLTPLTFVIANLADVVESPPTLKS